MREKYIYYKETDIKFYCSKDFQGVPCRPSGKVDLRQGKM
jgi:hypothetical protein